MSNPTFLYYKAQFLKYLDVLDERLLKNDYVKLIRQMTQVRPAYIAIGVVSFLLLFSVWGFGARFVTNMIGFAYPLYASCRALNDNQADETDSQWLTYWVVFGFFSLVESCSDFLFYWIPFYHLTKAAFLVWCFLPSTQGAQYLYHNFIEPVLVKYEPSIDNISVQGRQAAQRVVTDVLTETRNSISANPKQSKLADDAKKTLVADAEVQPEGEQ